MCICCAKLFHEISQGAIRLQGYPAAGSTSFQATYAVAQAASAASVPYAITLLPAERWLSSLGQLPKPQPLQQQMPLLHPTSLVQLLWQSWSAQQRQRQVPCLQSQPPQQRQLQLLHQLQHLVWLLLWFKQQPRSPLSQPHIIAFVVSLQLPFPMLRQVSLL